MNTDHIEDIYPLAPMQQGMLFHSLLSPESAVYVEQMSCKIVGDFDVPAFEKAWQKVIDRNPILRTAFVWEGLDEPVQIVQKDVKVPFEIDDWKGLSAKDQEKHLAQYMKIQREKGFNLAAAPLMRIGIFKLAENQYYFAWTHHHLLFDGWSMPLLLEDLFAFYEAYHKNIEIFLPERPPFKKYIEWLQVQDVNLAEKFWRGYLNGFSAPTAISIDKKKDGAAGRYCIIKSLLSAEESETLRNFVQQEYLTLNTLIQSAWAKLLHIYSGEANVVFGATVSGRPPELPGSEVMIGLFINTLPVRVRLQGDVTVREWLKEQQQKTAELRQYEYSRLPQIQSWSSVPHDTPLFESILVVENYPTSEALQNRESSIKIADLSHYSRTNYPLTVVASTGSVIGLEIAFEEDRYDRETIDRILDQLKTVLLALALRPESKLSEISILSDEEKRIQLYEWNKTDIPFPDNECIHELFAKTATKNADRPAVVFNGQKMTYKELDEKANRLAVHLQTMGVGPEVLVGICLDRSFEMIFSLLAVLKAGGAYVPMDPAYPVERLNYMIKDSGIQVFITQKNLVDGLQLNSSTPLYFEEFDKVFQEKDEHELKKLVRPENLAYVIYTSGSTGQPKGTLMQHRGLCNFVQAMAGDFPVTPQCRVLQSASFSFDASVAEIFAALISGASLYLIARDTLVSGKDLAVFLRDNKITTVTLPPSLLANLPEENLPDLQTVVSVGEACSWEVMEKWSKGRRFLNGYGPTEATVGTTWGPVSERTQASIAPPIGKPIQNARVYILNSNLEPVPIGVEGQLFISGVGLSRGYLNRPHLTAERFLPNPFSNTPGARMYASGDLARYLPDGNIEFVGRIDHQVKLRGFRVELGEIESTLLKHPAVKQAVVIAREDVPGDKRLVAYIMPQDRTFDDFQQIAQYARDYLPNYMLPSAYVKMEEFPLTPNRKIDHKALPAPEKGRSEMLAKYVAPRSPIEEILISMFQDILGVERVGIYDNFFDLGGHSLLATQLLSRIRESFNIEFPLRIIFESPDVAHLAQAVEKLQKEQAGIEILPIKPVPRDGDLPLSYAQQRLWFLDQLTPNNAFYNIPVALRIRGQLNVDALQKSIDHLIARHETLRTVFKEKDGQPYQVILPELKLNLQIKDLKKLSPDEREKKVKELATKDSQKPFDLANGPLLRTTLLYLDEDDYAVFFTMHHIISDGWSVNVLVQEIAKLYAAYAQNKEPQLPELEIQYADFAHWQRQWLQGDVLDKQLGYWKEKLTGSPPLLELPIDRPRPAIQTFDGATISRTFSRELLDALKSLSKEENVTLFMTLLTAFYALLYKYTGQEDINVGTPIANRNRAETESLIGFFVNTLVLRCNLSGNPTFLQLLEQVREIALGAYAHQDIPFEMLVEELQPERDLSHTPLFQVMFLLQNMPAESVRLPDIEMSPIQADSGSSKFDMTFMTGESVEGLWVGVEYNTRLFDATTIEEMLDRFELVLTRMVQDPEERLGDFSLLSAAEREKILIEWNESEQEFPGELCAHQMFEKLAEKQPDAIAVSYKQKNLTYSELNRRANQLARFLQKNGIRKESLVGISVERAPEMVVGIMATLKAGGAFVPIDPTYPEERIAYMLNDSEVKVLLTQGKISAHLPAHQARVVKLDADWPEIETEKEGNLDLDLTPQNLAYVIYTSGSTGRPKGTLLQHQGLCNLVTEQMRVFNVGQGSRILQFSSLSFDASVWETVMALLSGATLCLTDRENIATGQGLLKILKDDQISTVTLPPSVLAMVPEEPLPNLKTIITAGEKCTNDLVEKWADGRQFFNAYGPTETTVCASMHLCQGTYPQGPPIGHPIANTQLYVLDKYLNQVSVRVPGELHISGVSLARGYLKRPDLTAEKFIPNPFASQPGARMYKTGDLVRYLPNGNIEFLGRIDHQVKVRGFRIELGEIEAILNDHPEMRDAVVLAREDLPGDVRLVAYMVCENGVQPPVGEIRKYLRERLPDYMLPSHFIFLEFMPLTPSGKIDRRALPAPDQSRPELEVEYVEPRNEAEKTLAEICSGLLNVEKVGVFDNFFDLGGHSLLATQFMSRVRDKFSVELPLRVLFEKPTVAELAEEIERASQSQKADIPSIQTISRQSRRMKLSDLQKKSQTNPGQ